MCALCIKQAQGSATTVAAPQQVPAVNLRRCGSQRAHAASWGLYLSVCCPQVVAVAHLRERNSQLMSTWVAGSTRAPAAATLTHGLSKPPQSQPALVHACAGLLATIASRLSDLFSPGLPIAAE